MMQLAPIGVAYEPIIDLDTDRPILMQALPEPHRAGRESDAQVLRLACEELAGWARSGLEVGVCVPLDATTLGDPAFPNDVERLAAELGCDLRRLQLGLTAETVTGAGAMPNAMALRDKGVTLCLLDYGSGFQSLSSLVDLPCQRAEIAAAFVTALERRDTGGADVVAAMVASFRMFGVRAGAVGVATASTLGVLSGLGFQTARGPAVCDPMGPAVAHQWLLQERGRRGAQH